jgi:hypothetical protein
MVYNLLKTSDPIDFVTWMNHGWSSPLSPREHNINELRGGGHRVHLFKIVDRHGVMMMSR